MDNITVSRRAVFPDLLRIERYKNNPEFGPRPLFFSGGTALNAIAQELKNYTYNSIHLVTPFDSGGSSQILRKTFGMPAIGDLRSRMIALADETILGHPEIFRLFTHRFKTNTSRKALNTELQDMVTGSHPLVEAVEYPMRTLIMNQLAVFNDARPADFDLKGANIGNLILAGGYLSQNEELESVLFLFSKLVGVRGTVRSIVDDALHLGACLENGDTIIGQHLLTGKEHPPIPSPISNLYLNAHQSEYSLATSKLTDRNQKLINSSDLICYAPGSFYSSLIANLLPEGVGNAIACHNVPKVFVPSLGNDPEAEKLSIYERTKILLSYLKKDAGIDCDNQNLLNFIVIDEISNLTHEERQNIEKLGVCLIELNLTNKKSKQFYDPKLVTSVLLSLT